nr:Retrovirus-related Pol polyprotein from transposon TNT 1-94 [Ipomoea batatas]
MYDPSLPIIPTMNCEEFNFQVHNGTQSQTVDNPMDNDVHSGSYNEQDNGNFSHVGLMQDDNHINESNQNVETNGSNTAEPLDNTDSPSNNNATPTDYSTDNRSNPSNSIHVTKVADDMQLDTSPVQPRRSGRQRQMPLKLQDFYCDSVIYGKSTPQILSKVVSYDMLEPSHKVFSIAVNTLSEPKTRNVGINVDGDEITDAIDDAAKEVEAEAKISDGCR